MSNYHYKFGIHNYHAIDNAEIDLSGITVLAGINGCGKSTIARSLYSIINGMNDFEFIQKERFCRILDADINRLDKLFNRFIPIGRLRKMISVINSDEDFENGIKQVYFSYLDDYLRESFEKPQLSSDAFVERAYKYLIDEAPEGRDVTYLIEAYKKQCHDFFYQQLDVLYKSISDRSLESLWDSIQRKYPDCSIDITKVQLAENDVHLIYESRFDCPLMLDRAIYVDTPMVLSVINDTNGNNVQSRFRSLMFVKDRENQNSEDKQFKLILKIRGIIGGNIVEVDDLSRQELHYKTFNGLDIDISETATGIKSFAYILRLLENGWLNDKTLLIIDEPEAHLHPQWVVEFAKILVLLQKELGVRVLVASHNPDMVAAIHDISEYYNLSKNTNFYIAKENGDNRYDYHCLGNDIGDIFEAFNVALTKIEAYSVEGR